MEKVTISSNSEDYILNLNTISLGYYLELTSKKKYPEVGICIYCFQSSNDQVLTEEHIIPYGLSGELVLPNSSCKKCQKIINDQFENFVLGTTYILPRVNLNFKSRKKSNRTKKITIWEHNKLDRGGFPQNGFQTSDEFVQENFRDVPTTIISLVMKQPGLLLGKPKQSGGGVPVIGLSYFYDGNSIPAPLDPEKRDRTLLQKFIPEKIMRFVAKIAHGAAAAELGVSAFKPFLPNIILGNDDAYSHFIGSPRFPARSHDLHSIRLYQRDKFLVAQIGLFSRYKIYPFEVVVGELKKPLLDSIGKILSREYTSNTKHSEY